MLAKWREQGFLFTRRQAVFAMLLVMVLTVNAIPDLRASALYLISDGTAADGAEQITAEQVILVGTEESVESFRFQSGRKVTLTAGGSVDYATTRSGETVTGLLRRMGAKAAAMELAKVDVSQPEVRIEVASSFSYYETVSEPAEYTVTYTQTYTLPKGEERVTQPGVDGTRDVVYEVIYADGALVSRQAVLEENDTSVPEIVETGTCVKQAQAGDTVASVVKNDDGSGYLLMASGDALHFSKAIEVKCTAYTTGYGGVGTRTATGTTVRRGVVAVDKSVIPLGSTLYVDVKSSAYRYGMAYAEDTGIRGAKLDLYMDTYNECVQFGVRNAVAYILD